MQGVPVWVIVANGRPETDDAVEIARMYAISEESVKAAWAWYRRYKPIMDAELWYQTGEWPDDSPYRVFPISPSDRPQRPH